MFITLLHFKNLLHVRSPVSLSVTREESLEGPFLGVSASMNSEDTPLARDDTEEEDEGVDRGVRTVLWLSEAGWLCGRRQWLSD